MGAMSNGAYAAAYAQSLSDPDTFWGDAARAIEWMTPRRPFSTRATRRSIGGSPARASTPASTPSTGTCRDGRGDQIAMYYDSPVTGTKASFTYAALLDQVSRFAGALAEASG